MPLPHYLAAKTPPLHGYAELKLKILALSEEERRQLVAEIVEETPLIDTRRPGHFPIRVGEADEEELTPEGFRKGSPEAWGMLYNTIDEQTAEVYREAMRSCREIDWDAWK